MTSRHLLFLASLSLLALLAAASAQTVNYVPLDQNTVVGRLRDLERNNRAREGELKEFFAAAGCGGHLKEQAVEGSKLPNVVCVLPGATSSTIVVGAHFDHVTMGMGAIDNWTGASLLPSLYETLAKQPRQHTFVFIGFTDEEKGLVGSRGYVQQLTAEAKANIFAMVNFDSLGLGPTEAWGNVAAPGLLQSFTQAASTMNMAPRVLTIPGSDADSDSFSKAGIPAVTLHAIASMDEMRLLHSPNDQLKAINPAAFYGNYRFAVTYLLLLDAKSSLAPAQKNPPPAKTAGSGSVD